MKRFLRYSVSVILMLLGLLMVAGFVAIAFEWIDTEQGLREAGMLVGLGVSMMIAGVLLIISERAGRPGARAATSRTAALKLLVPLFALTVGSGIVLARKDVAAPAELALALIAVIISVLMFLRLTARWRSDKRLPLRAMLSPLAWGMVAATSLAVVMEGLFVGASMGGLWLGLRWADVTATRDLFELLRSDDFLTGEGSELLRTNTVALFAILGYAVAAPVVEEFTKFLGVFLIMRRRVMDRYGVFVAAISVGLGFAAVETLMYALASGTSWPYILALRTPVALIHLTGTALVSLGWYHHVTRGGISWIAGYAFAVLVHAAWNGLLIALMLGSAGSLIDDEPLPEFAVAALAVFALMAALLIGCFIWFSVVARKLGRIGPSPTQITDHVGLIPAYQPAPSQTTIRW